MTTSVFTQLASHQKTITSPQSIPLEFLQFFKNGRDHVPFVFQLIISQQLFKDVNNNSSTPTNTTTTLQSLIPSFAVNVSSLVNSFFFIFSFFLFFAIVIGMFLVAHSSSKKSTFVMKRNIQRNQKILLFLTFALVFIQICGLTFRVLYNGLSLGYNLGKQEIAFDGYFVVTQVFGMIENFLIEVQTVTIFVIMCFIQNVL